MLVYLLVNHVTIIKEFYILPVDFSLNIFDSITLSKVVFKSISCNKIKKMIIISFILLFR